MKPLSSMDFNNSYCCHALGVGHNTFYKENSIFVSVEYHSSHFLPENTIAASGEHGIRLDFSLVFQLWGAVTTESLKNKTYQNIYLICLENSCWTFNIRHRSPLWGVLSLWHSRVITLFQGFCHYLMFFSLLGLTCQLLKKTCVLILAYLVFFHLHQLDHWLYSSNSTV